MERMNELYQTWLREQVINAFNNLDEDSDYDNLKEIVKDNYKDFADSLILNVEEYIDIQHFLFDRDSGWDSRFDYLECVLLRPCRTWVHFKLDGEDWEDWFMDYRPESESDSERQA
jgi:hypothetical protein